MLLKPNTPILHYFIAPTKPFQHRRHGCPAGRYKSGTHRDCPACFQVKVTKGAGWMILFSCVMMNSCVFGGYLPVFSCLLPNPLAVFQTFIWPYVKDPVGAAHLGLPKAQQLRALQTCGEPFGEAFDEVVRRTPVQHIGSHFEKHKISSFLILQPNATISDSSANIHPVAGRLGEVSYGPFGLFTQ